MTVQQTIESLENNIINAYDEDRVKVCRIPHRTVSSAIEMLKKQNERITQLKNERELLTRDICYHNCNTCKRECEHRPYPGQKVRTNCFAWEGTKDLQE